jgi:hypothetical protein
MMPMSGSVFMFGHGRTHQDVRYAFVSIAAFRLNAPF